MVLHNPNNFFYHCDHTVSENLSLLHKLVCLFMLSFSVFVENVQTRISTIVIRGSTDSVMDEISRAIDDAVNTYKALTQV